MNWKKKTTVGNVVFPAIAGAVIFFSTVFSNSIISLSPLENSVRVSAQNTEQKDLPAMQNPFITVRKKERKLELYDGEKLIKTYKIALGFTPVGDKEGEGDGKTPEGEFYIFTKNPKSRFYLSLGVSYPNAENAERGLKNNLISQSERDRIVEAAKNKKTPPQKTKLGGEIYIHGNGTATDWTQGCVAVSDADMKEIFDSIPIGTKIKILP